MRYATGNGLCRSLACLLAVAAPALLPVCRGQERAGTPTTSGSRDEIQAPKDDQGKLKVIPWAGAELPAFDVVVQESSEKAQRVEASKEALQIALKPGRYVLNFEAPVLTPIRDVLVEAGRETSVDLGAVLGRVRVVPAEGPDFTDLMIRFSTEGGESLDEFDPKMQPAYVAHGRCSVTCGGK